MECCTIKKPLISKLSEVFLVDRRFVVQLDDHAARCCVNGVIIGHGIASILGASGKEYRSDQGQEEKEYELLHGSMLPV